MQHKYMDDRHSKTVNLYTHCMVQVQIL